MSKRILYIATGRYPIGMGNGVSSGQYTWIKALEASGVELKVAPSFVHYKDGDQANRECELFQEMGFEYCGDLDDMSFSRAPRVRMLQQALFPTRAGAYTGLAHMKSRLEEFIKREKPDLILGYGWPAVTLLSKISNRIPKVAVIVDLPDGNLVTRWKGISQLSFSRYWREALRLLGGRKLPQWALEDLKECDAVVEHAHHHAELLQKQGIEDVLYVPHCMPESTNPVAICSHPASNDPVNILMLGSLKGATSRLGFEFLLQEILPELRRKSDSIQYPYKIRVVGHGTMLTELREKLDQQPEIEFIGFADDVSEEHRLSHFMLVAIPTPVGFRTRIAEAFGYGQCVVAHSANCEGMPEIKNGENALCADNGKDVADLMISAINDGELRMKVAQAARDTFDDQYSIKAMQRFIEREIKPLA